MSTGSTWHPWDGNGKPWPDYFFPYNGREDHPFNRFWNPTEEAIVPSIRWRAVRAGVQDAHLLLWFQDQLAAGDLEGESAGRAQTALDEARALAAGERELSGEGVARLSRELREIYIAANR